MTREPRFRLPPFTVEATFVALAETVDWSLSAYGVPAHWKDTRGAGIRVAVLDTGVDDDHPDLAGAIDEARDFSGSRIGARDRQGHGTHVAGIIGARRNELGIVGVANDCRLLAGKVLGDDGSGSSRAVAAGIRWAIDQGAHIVSMSLGSTDASADLAAAIDEAVAAGVFVVCAAGNAGRDDSVQFPARLPNTLAVGAVDRHGRVCKFSSRGEQIDVCAPGEDILSTYAGGGYAKLSGTSMAAPFVTGIVALLLAKHRAHGGQTPVSNQSELVEHLCRTATDAGPRGRDANYGYGLINPDSVLAAPAAAVPAIDLRIGAVEVNGMRGALVFVREGES